MKKRYIFLGILVLLVITYFAGPAPRKPQIKSDLPSVSSDFQTLEQQISKEEHIHPSLKPDNEARIIWADSTKHKTRYSLVYLHGFSASQGEGEPVHREFAKRYGCNLYLSRLEEHGLDTADTFLNLTAEKLVASAQKAIAIGKQIGDSVIVMATSNGGALALIVAAKHPEIKALILYSPLIELFDPATFLLDKPWGLQIARQVRGGEFFQSTDSSATNKKYWTTHYRLEGLVTLKSMIANELTPTTFAQIKMPVFLGYYYKNEEEQDKVVSVKAMLKMYDELGTPASLKRKVNFPEAANHVIASVYKSGDVAGVRRETFKFADEILKLK
jgi:esterase/lipase